MEFNIREIAEENMRLSKLYSEARKEYGEATYYLDMIVSSELPRLQKIRSNMGYEMALLTILGERQKDDNFVEAYKIYKLQRYKGLDKVLEGIKEKLHAEKMIMRADGSIQ